MPSGSAVRGLSRFATLRVAMAVVIVLGRWPAWLFWQKP